MLHRLFLLLGLALIPVGGGALAGAQLSSLVVATNDTPFAHAFPYSERLEFQNGAFVATLTFDPEHPAKLTKITVERGHRRKSFIVPGDYYALWNRGVAAIDRDRTGRVHWVRFTLPLSTSASASERDHVLLVEWGARTATMNIGE